MGDTAQTYEAKPRRGIIERVVSGLSEHGVMFREGAGTGPEYTKSDYAAALGQLSDPMASGLFWGGFMGYPKDRDGLVHRLHLWGWALWAKKERSAKIDTPLHGRIAALAVFEQVERPITYAETIKKIGVGDERWRILRPHYADLQGRLAEAESNLTRHLVNRLKNNP